MAEAKTAHWTTPATLYTVVAQIYLSMYLVLFASTKPEDHWMRYFVMVYLLVMVILWTGVSIWSLRSQRARERASTANEGNRSTEPGPK